MNRHTLAIGVGDLELIGEAILPAADGSGGC